MSVKRIGALSTAKVQGWVSAAIGLIVGLYLRPLLYNLRAVMMSAGAAGGLIGGLAMTFLVPVFYAVIGVVSGALSAFVWNFAANAVGGLALESTDAGLQTPTTPAFRTPDSRI